MIGRGVSPQKTIDRCFHYRQPGTYDAEWRVQVLTNGRMTLELYCPIDHTLIGVLIIDSLKQIDPQRIIRPGDS